MIQLSLQHKHEENQFFSIIAIEIGFPALSKSKSGVVQSVGTTAKPSTQCVLTDKQHDLIRTINTRE